MAMGPNAVAVVVPMDGEFAPYRALYPAMQRVPADQSGPWEMYAARTAAGRPLLFVICDVGPVNAAAATERLLARFAPQAVLHGGSAGAHYPELLPGDVVLGERYVIITSRAVRAARAARGLHATLLRYRLDGERIHHHNGLPADGALLTLAATAGQQALAGMGPWDAPGWPAGVPPRPGRVMTGIIGSADAWTVDPQELAELHEDFGAACEDMESAYVAQVCALHGIPFLAVRAISDNEAACQLTPADVAPAIAAAGVRAAHVIAAVAEGLGANEVSAAAAIRQERP